MASSSRRSAVLVLVIVLACGCVGMLFGQRLTSTAASQRRRHSRQPAQFTQVYEVVQQNYAEPVNPDKAIYNGAIPGMLRVLDPHSNFFDPKSYCRPARRAARQVLRRGHAGRSAQQQGHRDRALRRRAGLSRGHPAGRRHHRRRRQADRQHEHQRRCRTAERAQGHHGQDHGAARRLRQAARLHRGARRDSPLQR